MNKIIRILFLDHHKEIIGGGQISLLQLLKGLHREEFQPVICCPGPGEFSIEAKGTKLKIVYMPMPSFKSFKIFTIFSSIRKIIRTIKEEDIDLIHSNSSRSMIYAALVRIFYKIPILWHIRITERDAILDRILQPFASKIIAISKAVAKRFSWMKNQEKIAIIHNGLDLKEFNNCSSFPKIKEEFYIKKATVLIGTAAKLQPKKGIHVLLQAIPLIRKYFSNAKFLIIGNDADPKEQYLQKLTEIARHSKEEKNIIFTGFRRDIPQLMSALDIFVMPSLIEPFGRVLLEAMAAEKAIVASRVGGIPEIVDDGETGILVPPGDTKKLAEAIISLIQNKSMREMMGKKGRKRVEEQFSIEKNVELTEKLYKKVLDHKGI